MENIFKKKQLILIKSLLEEMRVQFQTENDNSENISLELKNKVEAARKEKKLEN